MPPLSQVQSGGMATALQMLEAIEYFAAEQPGNGSFAVAYPR